MSIDEGYQMNDDAPELLLVKALATYGPKRCQHDKTTLVQHIDEQYGWFTCYQCDHCGQITQQRVSADDLALANDAPWLDVAMYEQVTTERSSIETLSSTLAFFGKAIR